MPGLAEAPNPPPPPPCTPESPAPMARAEPLAFLYRLMAGRKPVSTLCFVVVYELCSGTGKFAGMAANHPRVHGVVTVDNDPECAPTILADLATPEGLATVAESMQRHVDAGYLVVVHASPPCTQYSKARTTGAPRDLKTANAFVRGVVDLMQRFAVAWTLENPGTDHKDSLWAQPGFPELRTHVIIDYCAYGYAIKKTTGLAVSSEAMARAFPVRRCGPQCMTRVQTDTGGVKHLGGFTQMSYGERISMPDAFCGCLVHALIAEAERCMALYERAYGGRLLEADEFYVEKVFWSKTDAEGRVLVKWWGYAEPTWEPARALREHKRARG